MAERRAGADRGHEPAVPNPRSWTFLTNHAHVLIAISRNPELRQREIGDLVGITEGAVQRIVNELEDDGYVARERVGRRNRYVVIGGRPLRHPLEAGHSIEEIIDTVNRGDADADTDTDRPTDPEPR
jgi:DNA-binding HxlR family transcriptional regulator